MTYALLLVLVAAAAPDSTEYYFARKDVASLEAWCAGRVSEHDRLHCRYRLYPLTREESLLDGLPDEPEHATARSLAILSGLWGFRASESGFPAVVRHGMRAQRLIDRARELDPDEPFVLLVDGQSLLFKPGIFGGDRERAAARFEQLSTLLERMADPPMYPQEADVWRWYALESDDRDEAAALRESLLASDPLPVFRDILENPPS